MKIARVLTAAAFATAFAVTTASAQAPQGVPVIGQIQGVDGTPQADGSQKAIRVIIFAEPMRGNGEGHRPWTRPNTTMTNATVDTTVSGVDGQNIMVKYKDGDKKIVIGSDAVIRKYVAGDKSELKPGAHVGINANRQPDGSLQTARVNVGRGDVVPD